ncbi:uncharacterized protein L201_003241 [Kwoniella dendrophila CBS 6074]|uniref:Uncharacterized protein n=1 Tax=Kwoniella dendrophila CBS 6074 TaxID=1295534 RepID=A0AAX4JSE7_9TREE
MRVRLPPSVISQIASYLQPNFNPVVTLSSQLEQSKGTKAGQQAKNCQEALISNQRTGETEAHRVPRPLSDNIPISASYIFRTATKSHIQAAHDFLSSEAFDHTVSDEKSILRRQITYSRLVAEFLRSNHPYGLTGVKTLLDRSLKEKVPISISTLTLILQSTLKSKDGMIRKQIISRVLPLLPQKLDIPLLDLVLRIVIKDLNPGPEVIEKMINECLSLENPNLARDSPEQTVGRNKDHWPLEIWDLLLLSFYENLDFKGALTILDEFNTTLQSVDTKQFAYPTTNNSTLSRESTSLTDSVQSIKWNEKDKQSICKIYTTVLNTWRRSSDISKRNSSFPSDLANKLIQMINQDRELNDTENMENPNSMFLNSWMKAETLAGNYQSAKNVWRLIDSQSQFLSTDGEGDQQGISRINLPNSDSWFALFQFHFTYNIHNEKNSQSIKEKDGFPSILDSVKRLFMQSERFSKSDLMNILLLNTALKCTLLVGDLPMTLFILNRVKDHQILPDRYTIDIISSTLMSIISKLPMEEQKKLGINVSNRRRDNTYKMGSRKKMIRMRLNVHQWDLITEAIHQIRKEEMISNQGNEYDKKHENEVIWLPLSKPIARLHRNETTNYAIPEMQIPVNGQSIDSTTTTPLASPIVSFPNDLQDETNAKPEKSRSTPPEKVLPALTILLERLIVHLGRHKLGNNQQTSNPVDYHKTDRQILDEIMDNLHDKMIPDNGYFGEGNESTRKH